MTATVNPHQAARMLHFLRNARVRLAFDLGDSTPGEARDITRELDALDRLLAEVGPIINPATNVPPGLQDRNGNTR